jgi:hypothetical protein
LENKAIALSYAAYRAAVDLFPQDEASVYEPLMASLGLDPGGTSTDPAHAAWIGNLTAQAVLEPRHRDGANQLGDEHGCAPGVPYSDYTGFEPVNAPMDIRLPFDRSAVVDPNQWQPLRYVDGTGTVVTPAGDVPDASVPGVRVGAQHVQRGGRRDPAALHRQRQVRRLGSRLSPEARGSSRG